MKEKKIIICLLSAALLLSATSCKKQVKEPEDDENDETEIVTIDNIQDCEDLGNQYWDFFKSNDTIAIAQISREDIRADYLAVVEDETTAIEDWSELFIEEYISELQTVQGVSSITDNTARIEYSVLIPDFTRNGAMRSYNTVLEFEISDNEVITITNPEVAFEIQRDMISEYAIYLVNALWIPTPTPEVETEPEPTPEPTPTPTPEPEPIIPEEFNPVADVILPNEEIVG